MTEIGALLTGLALVAALVARGGVAVPARSGGVPLHLRRVLTLIAVLMAFRLAAAALPAHLLVAGVLMTAAWLPLMTLRLAEELVRRHAPRAVKLLALVGAIGFSVLAVSLDPVWADATILSLALFQGLVVAAVLVHLLRHRSGVSMAERLAINMLALAFVLAAPLIATDFRALFPELPFRGGAFAALVFVLACSRLAGEASSPLRLIGDVGLAIGAALVMAGAAVMVEAPVPVVAATAAVAAAATALALLFERFAFPTRRVPGLLAAVARAGGSEAAILSSHPLLAGAVPVSAGALADIPADVVTDLAAQRVVSRSGGSGSANVDAAARELLTRTGASHLLRLSQQPPRFVAVSGGVLEEERLRSELVLVARLLERAP